MHVTVYSIYTRDIEYIWCTAITALKVCAYLVLYKYLVSHKSSRFETRNTFFVSGQNADRNGHMYVRHSTTQMLYSLT